MMKNMPEDGDSRKEKGMIAENTRSMFNLFKGTLITTNNH
jgi:hypothetical protein